MVFALLAAIVVGGVAWGSPDGGAAPTHADGPDARYVITPGQEAVFAAMLGADEALPGGCTLSDGRIDRTVVIATYVCGSGEVVLRLVHPDDAPGGAVRTQRFALTVDRGAPPAGFVAAVAGRIAAREAAFEWKTPRGTEGATSRTLVLLACATVIAALVVRAVRRRRAV